MDMQTVNATLVSMLLFRVIFRFPANFQTRFCLLEISFSLRCIRGEHGIFTIKHDDVMTAWTA